MQSIIFLFLATSIVGQTIIPTNDPNWFFSHNNWALTGNTAHTANPGAYFKIGFTGTSVSLALDQTNSPSQPFMNFVVSIDDGIFKQFSVPQLTVTNVSLAKGLASATHSLELYVWNSLQTEDRWNTPSCAIVVTGLIVDSGAKSSAPALRSKRLLVFGDSITEGVETLCQSGGDLYSNSAIDTWEMGLAAALDAEISVVGFGRQGWTVTGNGNVPPVFTPGNDGQSAWNKIDAKNARNFSIASDYILILHGTNDNGASEQAVTASAQGWLVAQRAVSPNAKIFLTVPFGGFMANAINTAYNNYIAAYPQDKSVYFINLGPAAQRGLTAFNGGSQEGCDGIHPFAFRDGQLGAMLAVAVSKYL